MNLPDRIANWLREHLAAGLVVSCLLALDLRPLAVSSQTSTPSAQTGHQRAASAASRSCSASAITFSATCGGTGS